MRSNGNPIRRQHGLIAATVAAGAVCVGGTAWWALRTLPVAAQVDVALVVPSASESEQPESSQIDLQAFAIDLWNPVKAAPAPAQRLVETPSPLRLELIGIITEQGALHAALYDPDTDRLLVVGHGEQVRELTVTSIGDGHVELSDGRTTRRLSLEAESS